MTDAPSYLPLAFRLDTLSALIIGGGSIAAHKLRLLQGRCGTIHVWARKAHSEIRCAAEQGNVRLRLAEVTERELEEILPQMGLVFAATDDEVLNALVSRLAHQYHVPVCVVDNPALSSFITPALVQRDPVQVAITTGGASPVLARRLRQKIEQDLPAGLGRAARFMASCREWIRTRLPEMEQRRRVWEDFMDSAAFEAALAGDENGAQEALESLVGGSAKRGEVWLVGSGPGNVDLLTLAALRLMQNADSVLYDKLVSDEILDRVRRDAERIYVGKERSHHTVPQAEIHAEMVRRAQRGERVLRLKGGDPFIFGRGGEEMEALLKEGISVRVVPGITAANGCGASAGIPLTHRDCAQSCIFVTGHARADGSLDLHWPSLARKGQTVVVYMGLAPLATLCGQFMAHGLPADWPVAVIEKGTSPDERVMVGTLQDISDKVRHAGFGSPALVIIGEVVAHRGETCSTATRLFESEEKAL
ncbi:siroheme synthase CysG [Acetobacteraceae bacterium ESL0709]|nr:siroheme synthase CysG [Acetobacteraceae bacterium ESL0697]MDF7678508.1 siroheme synthase CysG [Acetobacteraceae bacterium ESL0709]